jgi:hypothetical protein
MRAAVLAAVFACAESWSPHARAPRTHLAGAPLIGLRGSQISLLQPAATADAAEEPSANTPRPAAVWRHARLRRRVQGLEREFGIPQLLGYLWPAGGPRIFGVCKAKLMVSLSLTLLFAAKMFVVKVPPSCGPCPSLPSQLSSRPCPPRQPERIAIEAPHAPSVPTPSSPYPGPGSSRCPSSSSGPSTL